MHPKKALRSFSKQQPVYRAHPPCTQRNPAIAASSPIPDNLRKAVYCPAQRSVKEGSITVRAVNPLKFGKIQRDRPERPKDVPLKIAFACPDALYNWV